MNLSSNGRAANPYRPSPVRVLDVHRETTDIVTLTLDYTCNHQPGQFVQLSVPGIGECPISICSDSREYVQLNVKAVGAVTHSLSRLRAGGTVFVRGPYGRGYPMRQLTGRDLLVIGGGCGIAPLKGIIDYVENHRRDYGHVQLFLGYRSAEDIIFSRELHGWKRRHQVTLTLDQNSAEINFGARQGFVTQAVEDARVDPDNCAAFVCGPPVMVRKTIELLRRIGFQEHQVFLSAERLMYCAIGACCHCMIGGKYTCLDGPVFRFDEVKDLSHD